MQQRFVSPQSEKVWLFHRGKWSCIDDPLYEKERTIPHVSRTTSRTHRRCFHGYELMWTLGPTFLWPDYSGSLVYMYVHPETRKARYLVRIVTPHTREIMYAQDLPDALELLHWFAPIINSAILVDLYRRGVNTFSHGQETS